MPEEEEREKLAKVIRQWNNNRLDLFEISQPDEVSRLQASDMIKKLHKKSGSFNSAFTTTVKAVFTKFSIICLCSLETQNKRQQKQPAVGKSVYTAKSNA
uniref:Uncharacterized protein n=1 Tax=Amphiprion percula TaxID=161767 RepID=A0A3P8SRX4_AMPPE